MNTSLDFPEPRARIQKSVSCLSLPEFTLVDGQGEQVLRQVTPSRRIAARLDRINNSVRPVSECEPTFVKNMNVSSNNSMQKSVSFDKPQNAPMENTPLLTISDEVIVEIDDSGTPSNSPSSSTPRR